MTPTGTPVAERRATDPPAFLESVEILPGCTVCGYCEAVAPEIFSVGENGCRVRPESRALWGRFLEDILAAERACPSGAIRTGIGRCLEIGR